MNDLAPITIDPATFLRQHCVLPALPHVVHQIQEMIHSDTVEIPKIVDILKGDPSLVAQILKIVNSAYYGIPKEVSEVRFAIAFLGLNEVYRMVLSLSVINTLSIEDKQELDRFWFHSFYAAICTKHLARKFAQHLSFEELWSAAILHDIGKLVYLKFYPAHYHILIKHATETGCMFSEAESHFGYPSSAYMGSLLCDHWRLPGKVKDACKRHGLVCLMESQSDSLTDDFTRMICMGNLMAIMSVGERSDDTNRNIASTIRAKLQYNESEFLALMGEIYDLRGDADKFMGQFI
ncbi:MAG: HDOD domain-containing protein [Deltaproteobacteria bacterium]|nr:HDOD domain-containing protein [Deltaproteobacteria bacterium]